MPFIVRWPSHISAGTESDQVISLADVLATSAGLLEKYLPQSAGVDSFDLSPVMLGKKVNQPIRTNVISQTGKGVLAFRDGDWKIRFSKVPKWSGKGVTLRSPISLYNLADDPTEEDDLSQEKSERVKKMSQHLKDLLKQGRSRQVAGEMQ